MLKVLLSLCFVSLSVVAAPVLPAGNVIVYENAFRAVAEADIAADLRGFGENGRLVHVFYGVRSADEELAVLAHLVGEKLVGKRAEDIIAVAKHVGGRPKLVAKGRAAIPAAHAYYTARELFAGLELVDPPSAWAALWTDDGLPGRFADIVCGAWAHYDWTDLTK